MYLCHLGNKLTQTPFKVKLNEQLENFENRRLKS